MSSSSNVGEQNSNMRASKEANNILSTLFQELLQQERISHIPRATLKLFVTLKFSVEELKAELTNEALIIDSACTSQQPTASSLAAAADREKEVLVTEGDALPEQQRQEIHATTSATTNPTEVKLILESLNKNRVMFDQLRSYIQHKIWLLAAELGPTIITPKRNLITQQLQSLDKQILPLRIAHAIMCQGDSIIGQIDTETLEFLHNVYKQVVDYTEEWNEVKGPFITTARSTQVKQIPQSISHSHFVFRLGKTEEQLSTLIEIKNLVNVDDNGIRDALVNTGTIPPIVNLMLSDNRVIQYEAAWILNDYCITGTTEQTKALVDADVLQILNNLIDANEDLVLTKLCIRLVGNIAGDSVAMRDIVLSAGSLQIIMKITAATSSTEILTKAAWAMANMVGGKPNASINYELVVLPKFVSFLNHTETDILKDSMRAIGYIADGPNTSIQAVVNILPMTRVVDWLGHADPELQTPALRLIGNIVTGNNNHVDAVLNAGALPQLVHTLKSDKRNLITESLWALSNIAAGSRPHIQRLLDNETIMNILSKAVHSDDLKVKSEAAYVFRNMANGASHEQIHTMVSKYNAVSLLCSSLSTDKAQLKVLQIIPETLHDILKVGESFKKKAMPNPYAFMIDEVSKKKMEKIVKQPNLPRSFDLKVFESLLEIVEDALEVATLFVRFSSKTTASYCDLRVETELLTKKAP